MNGLGIFCPGQGGQHKSMFDILSDSSVAQSVLQSVVPVFGCHPRDYLQRLSPVDVFANQQAQLLIGILQLATWAALSEILPAPKLFAGYSMGELVAYGCAEALDIEATMALITQRARLMDAEAPQASGLLAVRGLGKNEITALCDETGLQVAIVNGQDHYIVGGQEEAMLHCERHPLSKQATTIKRLQVTVPSHTSWLSAAGEKFSCELERSSLGDPLYPVFAGVSGALVRSRGEAIIALTQQISRPINWMVCMQAATEMGCNVILELGPGNALSKMLQEHSPGVTVRSVADFRSLKGVATWVQKQFS